MNKYFCLVIVSVFVVGCSSSTDVESTKVAVTQSAAKAVESASEVVQATNDLIIYPSAEETQPLQVGAAVPGFNVLTVDGGQKSFPAGQRDKPLMLVTFRGGWCPFCNVHLEELQEIVPELSAAGMEVAFLSGDRPEILYAGLKDGAQATAKDKNYVIYSDANVEAASALGIAFKTPEVMRSRLIDKAGATDGSVDLHSALSVPSIYIVATSGQVAFVHTDPDYKVRLSAEDTKAAAMEVLASN
jgi:Peroxiredoxin